MLWRVCKRKELKTLRKIWTMSYCVEKIRMLTTDFTFSKGKLIFQENLNDYPDNTLKMLNFICTLVWESTVAKIMTKNTHRSVSAHSMPWNNLICQRSYPLYVSYSCEKKQSLYLKCVYIWKYFNFLLCDDRIKYFLYKSSFYLQVKSVLEFLLWGPADATLGGPRERETSLQRWLDLERATVLHALVRARAQLSVADEYQLLFLVRTSAKIMCEASLLLDRQRNGLLTRGSWSLFEDGKKKKFRVDVYRLSIRVRYLFRVYCSFMWNTMITEVILFPNRIPVLCEGALVNTHFFFYGKE